MMFDIAIRTKPREERALRRRYKELRRARITDNPSMILLPLDFDQHTVIAFTVECGTNGHGRCRDTGCTCQCHAAS
jgi:hypothetical protein